MPEDIEQIAIVTLASRTSHRTLAGRTLLQVSDLMRECREALSDKKIASAAVSKHLLSLRSLQFVVQYRQKVFDTLRWIRHANQAR